MSSEWRARVALVFLVACFYAGVVIINNSLLFSWAGDDAASYRYWIYPPAGVRLALILLLGWPGVLGYFIAVLALIASGVFPELDSLEDALVIAAGRALSIWAALLAYGSITGVETPWERLTSRHLPALALFVSVWSAAVACLLKVWLGVELLEDFARNVSLTVLGDTLGTIIVLAILIRLRKAYKRSVQAEQSEAV
jgi:integral membrane sensor domain MASE1